MVTLIPETPVPGKPLGRHIEHDPLSRNFQAQRAPAVISVRHRAWGLPLTQTVGSCTAEALVGACNSQPNYGGVKRIGWPRNQAFAMRLYALETKNEGQPYPPNDPGGTGVAVCKAGRQLGLVRSYQTAFGIQHALEALVVRPVITGVAWYDSFDAPDSHGIVAISPGAQIRGGHEIVAVEIDAAFKLVWFFNSWGKGYGLGGRFAMSWATWDALLQDQGDVTVPIAPQR